MVWLMDQEPISLLMEPSLARPTMFHGKVNFKAPREGRVENDGDPPKNIF